jgi:peptidyl-prolyl cis-trans isomerase A (cyclophilin A)
MTARARSLFLLLASCAAFACGSDKPPESPKAELTVPPIVDAGPPVAEEPVRDRMPELTPLTPSQVSGAEDPLGGRFTLAEATDGLAGSGPLTATIKTSLGTIKCELYEEKAPINVANFVGLARGIRPWKSQAGWVRSPAYDGTTFHRIIQGFMIQGGDPKGNGSGEPGYTIKDEDWPGAKHDRAGLLCAANRGPDTAGMQFFITDASTPHLDFKPSLGRGNAYTIFGECLPIDVVHAIAGTPPPVKIDRVRVTRH